MENDFLKSQISELETRVNTLSRGRRNDSIERDPNYQSYLKSLHKEFKSMGT